ncbi:unnamed protein product [Didymodactylos carnosus]|uniref:Uncharacterized protein n=1 Tax=Didymodactylos carnosus TaxID=1234261 RepID=A0A8S2F2D2_9BILA|nr:unnamed protein product [Didymodactylos carnosus]CAF4186273.1 unnamed protein product [Didymodactylos carnosus]
MADVKDKFEKGIEKPRIEKRLDFRVQSGITSTKKQQFEHGEFEQETEPHVSKVVVDTDLLSGATSERRERFEKGDLENRVEKTTTTVDIPLQSGVASEKKAKFERGDFDDHEHVQKQQVEQIPSGMATEKKQKFESGQVGNDLTLMNQRENLAKSTIEPGIAQAKRDEFMSKISSDTIQWTSDKYINIDTLEHGSATSKRKEFESLATSEFKATDKTKIEVQPGLASNIKEQYLSTVTTDSTINRDKDQQISPQIIVASGLTKERANVFENPDSDTVVSKDSKDFDNLKEVICIISSTYEFFLLSTDIWSYV